MPNEIETKVNELQQKESELKAKSEELEKVSNRTAEEEDKLAAIKLERERVIADIEEKRKARAQEDETFQQKFRKEQLDKATSKIFTEFGYTDEAQRKQLLDEFKRRDSGYIDADHIYQDLKRAHVSLNPDKYLGLEAEVSRQKKAAEEMSANQSTMGFPGSYSPPSGSDDALDASDIQAAQWAGIPIERYKELKRKGKI